MVEGTRARLPDLPLLSVAHMIARRQVSPIEVTEAALGRIADLDPLLNAFITVMTNDARAAAELAEAEIAAGNYRGPLHGIPVAIKDLFWTAGVRTTAGSRVLADFVPDEDATVVRRLRDAGAVLLGKANTLEVAFPSVHPDYGPARNPWTPSRSPGGSSSGSAVAVAAGMGYGALGTDSGGSIRIPAAYCGIVGLKPTYGRVSRHGIVPASWTLDHAGPMTRTVADCAALLGAIAGSDRNDRTASRQPVPDYLAALLADIAGIRIGRTNAFEEESIDDEVKRLVDQAIASIGSLGNGLVEVTIPSPTEAVAAMLQIMPPEAWVTHRAWLSERPQDYSPAVRDWLDLGARTTAITYIEGQRARRRIRREWLAALEPVDVLLLPCVPTAAPPLGEDPQSEDDPRLQALLRLLGPSNLIGFPSMSIPCGLTADGLPIGLQLIARPFAEAMLLTVAHAYERSTAWHRQLPPAVIHDASMSPRPAV